LVERTGIGALKRDPRGLVYLLALCEGRGKRHRSMWNRTLIRSRNCRTDHEFLLFTSHPLYGVLLYQLEWMKAELDCSSTVTMPSGSHAGAVWIWYLK
jgi:hypothetical protein